MLYYFLAAFGGVVACLLAWLAAKWALKFLKTYLFCFCQAVANCQIAAYHKERIRLGDFVPNKDMLEEIAEESDEHEDKVH